MSCAGVTGDSMLSLRGIALSFGNVRAIDGLDLDVRPGQIHGLIGPNGSGKTTTLNVISGYYAAKAGTMKLGDDALPPGMPALRAFSGIARTFQTPRVIGEASVLQNVMIGGTIEGRRASSRRCWRCRATGATSAGSRPRRAPCSASSGWKRWPMCAPTACSTASCASSRSRAR